MPTNEPTTREEWLENNRVIMELEGASEGEIFINSIQTKMALDEEIKLPNDVRLVDAYIAVLASEEAKPDNDFNPFLHIQPEDLMSEYGVSRLDAAVVYFLASIEYWPANLRTNTEVYDSSGRPRPQF